MKKFLTLMMICMLMLMTGCGGGDKKPAVDEKIKLGMITRLNVSETLLDNYFEKAASRMSQTSDMRAPRNIFFDNMNAMIAGLEAGQIDQMSTYHSVANYLIAHNDKFELETKNVPKISDAFCCAMRKDDVSLKDSFDLAIKEMQADGTLAHLATMYITDLKGEPPAVDMPKLAGVDTIKVAVTGDLPPMDLITADGKPAGFNTALLAEISKRIKKNIEIVQVDSGARATALTSKEVVVVFWVTVQLDDTIIPADYDKPEGVIVTAPYFTDEIAHVRLGTRN